MLLGLGIAWVLAPVPFLGAEAAATVPRAWQRNLDAATLPARERIARTVGVPPALEALLRERLGETGRLVLFCPYPQEVFRNLLRLYFERVKNLLYPTPRDVSFAGSAAELAERIGAGPAGRLIVLDGTQEDVPLPVPGRFELLGELRIGSSRLRYWLLQKPR